MAERNGRRAAIEIRSVNHRFMDVKLRGAPLEAGLEERVGARVRERITRGSVVVSLRLDGGMASAAVRVDVDAARRVHAELRQLAAALDLDGRVSLDLLCAQPGVLVQVESERSGDDALSECVAEALERALDDLVAMRDAEGKALAADLGARFDILRGLTAALRELTQAAPIDGERRLRERIDRLLSGGKISVDEARLAQEVAILADRMDVTEELVRIGSHLVQLADLVDQRQPVGRRLDFLVQELGREVNTVASKSQSAEIARLVVEAKAEIEKIREQVQNVE